MCAEQLHESHLQIAVCAQALFEGVETNAPRAELGAALAGLTLCLERMESEAGRDGDWPCAILRRQVQELIDLWAEGEDITDPTHSLVRWLAHMIRLEKRAG